MVGMLVILGCGAGGRSTGPPVCAGADPVYSADTWPVWYEDDGQVLYKHNARSGLDSTYIAVCDTNGNLLRRVGRIDQQARELSVSEDGSDIIYGLGQELFAMSVSTGLSRQITFGGRGCHWPEWWGRRIAYTRLNRFPFEPDSLAGLRLLEVDTGRERAVMRTATLPWRPVGPVLWSTGGDSLLFFAGDSSSGRMALMCVGVAGGEGRRVTYVDVVPGNLEWLSASVRIVFDARPPACATDHTSAVTYVCDLGTGGIHRAPHQLGDARVQFGYPFDVVSGGHHAVSPGLGNASVGVIIMRDIATGRAKALTRVVEEPSTRF